MSLRKDVEALEAKVERLKNEIAELGNRTPIPRRWKIASDGEGYRVAIDGWWTPVEHDSWKSARKEVLEILDQHLPPKVQPRQSVLSGASYR